MPSSHLILGRPLLLPPIPPSIRLFSNESILHMRWPKYWSFSFSIIPSKEIPRLIFRMDRLDLLAVQGILKSLLQHHSSKASAVQCSAFFMVQLSHPYVTTGKTKALTAQAFAGKVMSLLFKTLSRFKMDQIHLGLFQFGTQLMEGILLKGDTSALSLILIQSKAASSDCLDQIRGALTLNGKRKTWP